MGASKEQFNDIAENDGFLDDLHKRQPSFYRIDLATVQPTRAAIQPMTEAMLQSVEEGNILPEELIVKLKFLMEVFEEVRSKLNDTVRTEAEKHKEGMQCLGAKIECAEVGVKFDYSSDVIWHRLYARMQAEGARLKDRERLLKAVRQSMEVIDDETGEVILVAPPIKTSVSSVKVTLGK